MTSLTDRFARAVDYARIAHAAQVRKGTRIPYITHLLAVATMVIEYGGSEDQVIAGLLHDTLEDCGQAHEAIIRAQFGDAVADIVVACTDGTAEGKSVLLNADAKRRDWMERKLAYLEHLALAPDAVLLVSACDKLHNARAIVRDLEDPTVGVAVFDRFKGGTSGTLGYYDALACTMRARGTPPAQEFDAVVERMHALAGDAVRTPLGARGAVA